MEVVNKINVPVATSFLCCFTIRQGTQAILLYTLVQATYSLAMAAGSIIFEMPTYGYATSSSTQLFSALWHLAGLPIILLGCWAVQARNGAVLRIFLYYLFGSFVIDIFFAVTVFLVKDACSHLNDLNKAPANSNTFEEMQISKQDLAFACGIARGVSWLLCCLMLAIMAYCVYIVWSHIKELTDGGSAGVIARLMTWDEREEREWANFEANMQVKQGCAYGSVM